MRKKLIILVESTGVRGVKVMGKDKVAVYVSKSLYDEVERRVKESGGEFKTVEDYVDFVLREVMKEDENEKQVFRPEEEEMIKRRLKSLGYL